MKRHLFQAEYIGEAFLNEKKLSYEVEGIRRQNAEGGLDLEGRVMFKSPIRKLEDISASTKLTYAGRSLLQETNIQWAPDKKIHYKYTANTEFANNKKTFRGKMELSTPFEYAEQMDWTLQMAILETEFRADYVLTYDRRTQVVADIVMSKKAARFENSFSYEARLKTPWRHMEDLEYKVAFSQEQTKGVIMGEASVEYDNPRKRVALTGEVKMGQSNEITLDATIVSPVEGLEEVKITGSIKSTGDLHSKFSMKIERVRARRAISVEADVGPFSPASGDLTVVVKTPYRGMEEVELAWRHSKQGANGESGHTSDVELGLTFPGAGPDKQLLLQYKHDQPQYDSNRKRGTMSFFAKTINLGTYKLTGNRDSNSRSGRESYVVTAERDGRLRTQLKINHEDRGSRHTGTFELQNPIRPFSVGYTFDQVSVHKVTGEIELKHDLRDPRMTVKADVALERSYPPSGQALQVDIQASNPTEPGSKVVKFTSKIQRQGHEFSFNTEVYPNLKVEPNRKGTLEVSYSNARRSGDFFDRKIRVKIDNSVRGFEWNYNFKHSHTRGIGPGDDYTAAELQETFAWDAGMRGDPSKKMKLHALWQHFGRAVPSHKWELHFEHPGLEEPIENKGMLNLKPLLFENTIRYSRDERKKLYLKAMAMPVFNSHNNFTVDLQLVHPITNTNARLLAYAARETVSGRSGLYARTTYTTAERDGLENIIRFDVDRRNRLVELELKTPIRHLLVRNERKDKSYFGREAWLVTTEARYNGETPFLSQISYTGGKQPGLNWTVHYDADNFDNVFMLTGGYVNKTAIKFTAERHHNGRVTTDGTLSMRLKNSHVVHNRLQWRPMIMGELKRAWDNRGQGRSRSSQTRRLPSVTEMVAMSRKEVAAKMQAVCDHLTQEFAPFVQYREAQWKDLGRDVRKVRRAFKNAYKNNDYNLREIVDSLDESLTELDHAVKRFLKKVEITMEEHLAQFKRRAGELTDLIGRIRDEWNRVHEVYYLYMQRKNAELRQAILDEITDWVVRFAKWRADVRADMARCWQEYKKNRAERWHRVRVWLAHVRQDLLIDGLYSLAPYGIEAYRAFNNWYSDAVQWWDEFKYQRNRDWMDFQYSYRRWKSEVKQSLMDRSLRLGSALTPYIQDLHELVTDLRRAWDDLIGPYRRDIAELRRDIRQFLDNLKQSVRETYAEFTQRPEYQYILSVRDRIGQYKSFLERFRAARQRLMGRSSAVASDVGKWSLRAALQGLYHFNDTRVTLWDPDNGQIEFELFLMGYRTTLQLPTSPSSIKLPTMGYIRRKIYEWREQKGSMDKNIWDTYYKYKPSMNPRDWIPPYKAHAMMVGNGHFVTFDDKVYEFEGECSYVLTHDFASNRFTVIANMEPGRRGVQKKNIEVRVDGKKIALSPDYKVTIDGRAVELPQTLTNTWVRRTGDWVRVCNKNDGITVMCNWKEDICRFNISGWYFGQTGGLLGTYDYEAHNDWTKADRELTTDVTAFAESWNVGQSCRTRPFSGEHQTSSSRRKMCDKHFDDANSDLRPCFHQVNPAPYNDMCQKEDDHSSIIAYVERCKTLDVDLVVPPMAVTCKGPSGQTYSQESLLTLKAGTPQAPPSAADVVLVVQQIDCYSGRWLQTGLSQLVTDLQKSFLEAGISDLRVGVVGFGGAGVNARPHVHTADGGSSVLFDPRQAASVLDSLTLNSPGSPTSALDAISYAVENVEFRVGASKSLVLVACPGRCNRGGSGASYRQVYDALIDRDVTLHVLKQLRIYVPSKARQATTIFGVDDSSAYTNKDARGQDVKGDRALYVQAEVPKDECLALAQESNGTMFDASYMRAFQGTEGRMKQFRTVFTRRIAQSGRPSDCQMCDCVVSGDSVGMAVCHRCLRPTPLSVYNLFPSFRDPMASSIEAVDDEEEDQSSGGRQQQRGRGRKGRGRGRGRKGRGGRRNRPKQRGMRTRGRRDSAAWWDAGWSSVELDPSWQKF